MLFYLFLLFTVVPLAELMILIRIGQLTATWVPFAVVIATGVVGAALARWQGWQAMRRIREEARAGRVPAGALVDGVLILAAGLLLVTPGVMTDFVGFALLIPPARSLFKRGVVAWIKRNVEVHVTRSGAGFWTEVGSGPDGAGRDEIIDAKVVERRVEDLEE